MTSRHDGPVEGLDDLLTRLYRDRWAGGPIMRNELPCFVATVPPPASAAYRGRVGIVLGATLVADSVVTCVKAADDTYSWVSLSGGGGGGPTGPAGGDLSGTYPNPTVAQAVKLKTARTIDGQSFDGTANIVTNRMITAGFSYKFSRDGGAVGAIPLVAMDAGLPSIPNNAVITNILIDYPDPFISLAGPAGTTFGLGLESTGSGSEDISVSQDVAFMGATRLSVGQYVYDGGATGAVNIGIGDANLLFGNGVGASYNLTIKTTAARVPTLNIGVHAGTDGWFNLFLSYVVSD